MAHCLSENLRADVLVVERSTMTNCTNESQVVTMRSLPPSPVNPAVQLPRHTSSPANQISPPSTPASEEDDLALALRLSQLSFDKQVARLHHIESAVTREEAYSSPPPESDEDDLELALIMSQLPADEQAIEINRQKGFHTADENSASRAAITSPPEVRTASSL